jgi:nucleotide-binding universal stress UspA family protein
MKTILVPVSFSRNSINAASYAVSLAADIGAKLDLLYVMRMPLSVGEAPLSETFLEEMEKSYREEMENLKQKLTRQTNGSVDISAIMEWGIVEQKIENYCLHHNPFLVVMGISSSTLRLSLLGSNTLFAIGRLLQPLLVIPEEASYHAIRRIGLACDLSHLDSIPVEYFRTLQGLFHARLDIIHINRTKDQDSTLQEEALRLLRAKLNGLPSVFYLIDGANVEEGIIRYLKDHPLDMLLLLPQRHQFFEFHSSHAKKIAARSNVPILSIHQ